MVNFLDSFNLRRKTSMKYIRSGDCFWITIQGKKIKSMKYCWTSCNPDKNAEILDCSFYDFSNTCFREQMLIRFIWKDRSFRGDYSWFNIRKNPFEWNIVEPQSWGGWWRNSHWDKWDKWDWGHRSWGIVRFTKVQ